MPRKPKDKGKRPTKREAALEDYRLREKKLRAKYFMGRRDLFEKFERLLATPPDGRKVWSIYGIGGIGKSWLLAELGDKADEQGFLTINIDLKEIPDPETFFQKLWECLPKENRSSFRAMAKKIKNIDKLRRKRRKAEEYAISKKMKGVISGLRKVGAVALDTVALGAGTSTDAAVEVVSGVVKGFRDTADDYGDKSTQEFNAEMIDALASDLYKSMAKGNLNTAILLDKFERCNTSVVGTVLRVLEYIHERALIVIAGRESLLEKHLPRGEGWEAVVEEDELQDLEKDDIREWLKPGAGASDEEEINASRIKDATVGFPLLVTFVLETLGNKGLEELPTVSLGREITEEKRQEFFNQQIMKVLKKLDRDDAGSLRIAAFPRRFNGTLFSTLFEKLETDRGSLEVSKFFKKIRGYSFVRREGDWFNCHLVLQDAVRFEWLEENKKLWKTMNEVCLGYFDTPAGMAAFLETIFHDYQLRPFESWQKFAATYREWSGDEETRPVADAMLEDFSSYCAQAGAGVSENELFQIFDSVDTLLFEYPRGDRAALCLRRIDLLEAAIAAVKDSVREASLNNSLGNSWCDLPTGNRAENIEKAIKYYELALEVYTREAFPADWAMAQNNLGAAYSDRIRGERAENIESAIEHYKMAQEVWTREAFPADWAMTQNNLGAAYSDRISGERADNIENAIEHFKLALEVYTREAFPAYWATTQNNLGAAYSDRIRGERAENIENAIEHHTQALDIHTHESFPIEFGETKHNLALVYLEDDFPFPEKERLEIALGHLEEACEVLDPDYQVHRIAFKKRDEVKARLRELEEEGE